MHNRLVVTVFLVVPLSLFTRTLGQVDGSPPAQNPPALAPSYPESSDGLKSLLGDLFQAEKAGDDKKTSFYYANLAIPNHNQWFSRTFGNVEGSRLDTKYASSLDESPQRLQKRIQAVLQPGRTVVKLLVYQKPEDTSVPSIKTLLAASVDPITIYHAVGMNSPDDKSPFFLGDFVYVDGGFRYLDTQVMQALSTAPLLRVRIGGTVQRAKLLKEVNPAYPQGAIASGTQGTVKLHGVFAKDGSVQQVDVVSGEALLAQAAADAVRQWTYQPTLLNGQPAEVDTAIDVTFSLKKNNGRVTHD